MKVKTSYRDVGGVRDAVEVIAAQHGFVLSSFKVEEYPGSEWDEPTEIIITLKQPSESEEEEDEE